MASFSSAPPAICFSDVSFTADSLAGPVPIVQSLSFNIAAGEAVSLTGPSGSGKTTIMMLAAGLERPNQGDITLSGRSIIGWSEAALAQLRRDHIGIVFQNFHLIPTMTALENVAVPAELAQDRQARAKAHHLLEQVGLGHRLSHYPGQLSGGEQQRVALARAFVATPSLLLADEPTGNLDQETGHQIIELIFSLCAAHQTTLVLVTHDPQLAARCQRSLHLVNGQLQAAAA